jgi:hypothetical protein
MPKKYPDPRLSWTAKTFSYMKTRCLNTKHNTYKDYGAKGIKICDRWLEEYPVGFQNFIDDMGLRPDNGTLDRIDGTKGYTPDNCRWATLRIQQANTNHPVGQTGFKGVSINKGHYTANIIAENGKALALYHGKNAREAAKCYDIAVKLKYGDYAITNFKCG